MSNYLKRIRFETEFESDQVKIMLRPLTREDALRIIPLREKPQSEEARVLIEELFCKYAESVGGLRTAENVDVTIEEVKRDAYFAKLVFLGGLELIRQSLPTDPGKPASPSDAPSEVTTLSETGFGSSGVSASTNG